jgi:hypothetical protein
MAEAHGDGPAAGKLGMALSTCAVAVPAFETPLGPAKHSWISARSITDPWGRAAVADYIQRSTVVTGPVAQRCYVDLQDAVDQLRLRDVKAFELEGYVDTIRLSHRAVA